MSARANASASASAGGDGGAPTTAALAPATPLWSRPFVLICLANFAVWTAAYTWLGVGTLYALSLGVPETLVGLFPASSAMCGLGGQMVAGRLLVHGSRTWLMRRGPLVMVAGALLALAIPQPAALLLGYILLGSGYGLAQTASVVLATEVTPPHRRGQAVGIFGTFTTLGVLAGPATGVALLQTQGGWAPFALSLVMSLGAAGAALLLREPPRAPLSPREAAGGRLHPLVYFAALALGGMTATWGTVMTYLPVYALTLGLSNPGWYFTAQAATVVCLRAAMGGLSDRLGRVQILVPATLLMALGIGLLALRPPVWLLLLLAVPYGIGYAAFHPTTISLAYDVSSAARRGAALGLVGGAFSVGSGLGSLSMGWVLGHSSYETMFVVAALVPVATTGALLLAARHWRRQPSEPAAETAPRP